MKYTVSIDHKRQFIIATVEGKWNVPDSDKLSQILVDKGKEFSLSKALIDHRKVKIKASTLLAFRRPMHLKQMFGGMNPKVAFVYPKGKKRLYTFTETVAQNRGIQFRVFPGMDEAVTWLTALQSPV